MKHQDVLNNLQAVRGQVDEVLENIEAVRGPKYRMVVSGLMSTGNIVEMFAALESMVTMEDRSRDRMREIFLRLVHNQVSCLVEAADVSQDEMQEAMAEAERLTTSLHGMASNALRAAHNGVKFEAGDA
jgi:hypothetical protein